MNYSRKDFLKLSSGMAGALALSPLATSFPGDDHSKKLRSFGLQLWTVKDDMAKDPKAVLKQLASFGYKFVESFDNGPKGIYWGMTPAEFKKCLDDVNMTMVGTHLVIENDFDKKLADATEIGLKYLIFQWEGPGKTLDDYRKYAEEFNKKGELCKKNGLRFGYHNHLFSFQPINGEYPQDILMKGTEAELVDFEMDIHYVIATKNDPQEWFLKYPGRFKLCHIKDLKRSDTGKESSCILGEGVIDFPAILKTGKQNGMEYYIAEQEDYEGTTPLKSAEADGTYMRKLKF